MKVSIPETKVDRDVVDINDLFSVGRKQRNKLKDPNEPGNRSAKAATTYEKRQKERKKKALWVIQKAKDQYPDGWRDLSRVLRASRKVADAEMKIDSLYV